MNAKISVNLFKFAKPQKFRFVFALFFLLVFSSKSNAQLNELHYQKPQVNIGVSTGLLGIHFFLLPALELQFRRVSLRGSCGLQFASFDLGYEFLPFHSNLLKRTLDVEDTYLILSTQITKQYSSLCLDKCVSQSYSDLYILYFGLKPYISHRFALSIKVGCAYYKTTHTEFDRIDPIQTFDSGYSLFGEISYKMYFMKFLKND